MSELLISIEPSVAVCFSAAEHLAVYRSNICLMLFPERRKNRQKEEPHESQRPSYRPRVTRNIIEHYSPRGEDFLFPVMHLKCDVKVTYEDFDAADTVWGRNRESELILFKTWLLLTICCDLFGNS